MMRPTIEQLKDYFDFCQSQPHIPSMPRENYDELLRILNAQAQDREGRCVLPEDEVAYEGKCWEVDQVRLETRAPRSLLQLVCGDDLEFAGGCDCTLIESEGE